MDEGTIIYFHGNNWDWVRARQQYLMLALSKSFRIIYLDASRSENGFFAWRNAAQNLCVVSGLVSALCWFERKRLRFFAEFLGRVFSRFIRIKSRGPIYFWNAENLRTPYRFIPADYVVFDCIDPCFLEGAEEVKAHEKREADVLRDADLVFASASSLFDSCRMHNPNTHLLNNACAPDDYKETDRGALQRPSWYPEAVPVACFLGTLDWRFHFALMRDVCSRMPEVSFVFAGSIIPERIDAVNELRSLPNVVCPGRISLEEGMFLMQNCSVGLVPFIPGEMNDAVNPVKMYAYAWLGKPIVGCDIRELRDRPQVARIARSAPEFVDAVENAIRSSSEPAAAARLRAYALQNTWTQRAQSAREQLKKLANTPAESAAPCEARSLAPLFD